MSAHTESIGASRTYAPVAACMRSPAACTLLTNAHEQPNEAWLAHMFRQLGPASLQHGAAKLHLDTVP